MKNREHEISRQNRESHASIRAVWLLFVVVGVACSACATLAQSVETPEVSIVNLRLLNATLAKQNYELTLNVRNPNPIALPVRGLLYRVQLAGEDFASGETRGAFTIPANGELQFGLSVSTDMLRSLASLQRLFDRNDQVLGYKLGGELRVDLPFVRAIPFSSSGEINLANALRY